MTRKEHLDWCKQRALEYVERGELSNAITSMMSDMRKHPDTESSVNGPLAMLGIFAVQSGSIEEARRFIEGFN